MRTKSFQSFLVTACCVLAGCGSSNQSTSGAGGSGQGGTPGSTGTGGSATVGSSGGVTSSGGSSIGVGGIAPSGGTASTSGSSSAAGGGSPTGGVATTGSKAAGGSAPTGGVASTGGINSAAGGSKAVGGASSTTGGINAAGGATTAAGGATAATGGTAAATTGGTTAAAGAAATGGAGGATTCAPPTVTLTGTDAVAGTKITFNDNGGWCWYQDERAVVDTKANKLIVGSVASGGSRNGNIEATVYDLAAKSGKEATISTSLTNVIDDHNAPAFLVRPDGKYLAMYSSHRNDCITRASIYDGSKWGTEYKFDWTSLGCPWPSTQTPNTNLITYNNPWYVGTSIFAAIRSVDTDNAYLTSTDDGATFSYYGRLMSTKQVGYVAGYYKYWGNNTDRIDFVGTEAHPRDYDNSLWHGYIQDGKVYNSTGTVIDSSLKDSSSTVTNSKDVSAYTQVFKTGTTINGVKLEHAWNHDIVRYADGTIAILGQARVNGTGTDDPDKRMLYFRFDGTSWKATYLVKGGSKLYPDEQDYIGLGALVPDDPTTIYISTPYDPTTDTMKTGAKHEIWRGTTCDNGVTFKWTPVTANSTKDNIRPIVPKWDATHTALLWMQGTYTSAQSYVMSIVGIISGN